MTRELSIERVIAAPPARVWQVMTERTAEWWCPKPYSTVVRALDWRAGGAFHLEIRDPEGKPLGGADGGVLLEVTPERGFVFTDAFGPGWVPRPAFMVGFFELSPEGTGTRYRAGARHWTDEALEQHRAMGFEAGWLAVAGQLAALSEGGEI
jgi:uncharacterized protein YndB with AHSA1/START domain